MNENNFLKRAWIRSRNSSVGFLLNRLGVARPFSVDVGSLAPEEDEGLIKLLNEADQFEGPVIEIGTLIGATTMKLSLWASGKTIITVDNYCWNAWGFSSEEHFDLASHSLFSLVSSGRVQQVNMDKAKFYETYEGPSPSLVFLDAMHTYEETKKDIAWAKEVGTRIITGHDYCEEWPGVIRAVEEAGGAKELYKSVWRL